MKTNLVVTGVYNYPFSVLPQVQAVTGIFNVMGYDYRPYLDPLWYGWTSKLDRLIVVVNTFTDATHIMFTDAADVVVLCKEGELMERWAEFNHSWVYAAEPHIFSPHSFLPEDYPTPDVKYRYLNAGVSIGVREHMLHWLNVWTDYGKNHPKCRTGDQDWLAEHFIKGYPEAIHLDTNCDLFQCMCGSDPLTTVTPGAVHNNHTGTNPAVIHFNGGTDITKPERRLLWDHLI